MLALLNSLLILAYCALLACPALAAQTPPATAGDADSPPASKPPARPAKENSADGLKYVWIPPGTFLMGCSPGDSECYEREKPAHPVTLTRGFWMGQTEVRVSAFKLFAEATGKEMPSAPAFNSNWANGNMPMTRVNWNDASEYCTWAGGRLPTEAEWEYAARGGSPDARYGALDDIAWYVDNSGAQHLDGARILKEDINDYNKMVADNGNRPHAPARKSANGFGLYDTLGNLWEWVNDWYDPKYYAASPAQDPEGPGTGQYHVVRGGSWYHYERLSRVSYRVPVKPDDRNDYYGFRCVANLGNP
jgi:formylglycine-generating enzyme required for sulfatase activity